MNRWLFLMGLALVAGVGAMGWRWWGDPQAREIRRVQHRVLELAEAVSFREQDSPFFRVGYAEKVAEYFANATELDVSLGARQARGAMTRSELKEGAAGMRATARGLSVQFMDVVVTLGEGMKDATAHLTSKIYFKGEPDYWVQEFRLTLAKESDHVWRVRRISTVRTMIQ